MKKPPAHIAYRMYAADRPKTDPKSHYIESRRSKS